MNYSQQIFQVLLLIVLSRAILFARLKNPIAIYAFAVINIVAYRYYAPAGPVEWKWYGGILGTLVVLNMVEFFLLRLSTVAAIIFPIIFMIAIKYGIHPEKSQLFIGISYTAFRLSQLALLVRNGVVQTPNLGKYFSYAFYFPILSVGPIHSYEDFEKSLDHPDFSFNTFFNSLKRVLVGFTKCIVIANIFHQIDYDALLAHGLVSPRLDITIAMFAYFFFLYFNFSGACDIAIGLSGTFGLRVSENFDYPFLSRNIREFWTKWHMTLSTFMRDMVFSPTSKILVRLWGPKNAHHAVAITIFLVFVLIGLWHGLSWNFLIFGLLHAVGVSANSYYAVFLKRVLTAKQYRAYMDSEVIRVLSIVLTLSFMAFTLLFFGNSLNHSEMLLKSWLTNR